MVKRTQRQESPLKRWFPRVWRLRVKRVGLIVIGIILLWTGSITLRLTLALHQNPDPKAILILDGRDQRIRQAAMFAQHYPDLPIWISGSCSQRPKVRQFFATAPLSGRVHYDLQATDTVTHFTTLAAPFVAQGIRHVYVVTSDYHMARVKTIATIIFGSYGIAITPVPQPSQARPTQESWLKVVRDGLRSFMWLATGYSGAQFNPRLQGRASCAQ